MQVGLATSLIERARLSQKLARGHTESAVLASITAVVVKMPFTLVIVLFNARYALRERKIWARTVTSGQTHGEKFAGAASDVKS